MRRPKSNTTKIQQKLTQTPQKKEGKVVFHWAVLAQTEFCLFSTITFSKNFRLTIEDMNCLLNRRLAHSYTSSHCVTKAHHFSKHSISSKFFWATSSNWWFGVNNWWSSPFGKAMGTWINPRNPKSIPKKFLGLHRNWIEISKGFVRSGIGMTTRKPLRKEPPKATLRASWKWRSSSSIRWLGRTVRCEHHPIWRCLLLAHPNTWYYMAACNIFSMSWQSFLGT